MARCPSIPLRTSRTCTSGDCYVSIHSAFHDSHDFLKLCDIVLALSHCHSTTPSRIVEIFRLVVVITLFRFSPRRSRECSVAKSKRDGEQHGGKSVLPAGAFLPERSAVISFSIAYGVCVCASVVRF